MPFLQFVNKLFIYIVDHTLDISRTSTSGQSLPVQSDEHDHTSVKRIKLQTNNGCPQLASTFEVQQSAGRADSTGTPLSADNCYIPSDFLSFIYLILSMSFLLQTMLKTPLRLY